MLAPTPEFWWEESREGGKKEGGSEGGRGELKQVILGKEAANKSEFTLFPSILILAIYLDGQQRLRKQQSSQMTIYLDDIQSFHA